MIVRDLFDSSDEARVIARAIFEDRCEEEEIPAWISKYYSQLVKLKSAKVKKSNMMIYLSAKYDAEESWYQGDISGVSYEEIKADKLQYYSIWILDHKQYASLYVPDYTVQCFGTEVVASEALREYGMNGYDPSIECPEATRQAVLSALSDMKQELFETDNIYLERCLKHFIAAYEGKEVPQWKREAP